MMILGYPKLFGAFYDEIYAFDHVKHQVILIHTVRIESSTDDELELQKMYAEAQSSLDQMEAKVNRGVNKSPDFYINPDHLRSNMDQGLFY